MLNPNGPSPVSPTSGSAWELVRTTIEATYPGTIVAPFVMMAARNCLYCPRISDFVYRFSPFEMSADERSTRHATDERMHVTTLSRGVELYTRLVA